MDAANSNIKNRIENVTLKWMSRWFGTIVNGPNNYRKSCLLLTTFCFRNLLPEVNLLVC
jgi:hypothetical protein